MWVITGPWRDSPEDSASSRTLLPARTYQIGRSDRLLLGVKLKSVSRSHATIDVGPHSELDAADLGARPGLTIRPLPSTPVTKTKTTTREDGSTTTTDVLEWKNFSVHVSSSSDETDLPKEDEKETPAAWALKDGDIITFSTTSPRFRVEWRPVVLKLDVVTRVQADIVKKIAPLGIKVAKKDFEGPVTHLVLETVKAVSKPSFLAALSGEARVVSPSFVTALVEAAGPLSGSGRESDPKERWSALEHDAIANWPNEDRHAPRFEVAGEDAARGSLLWDGSRTTLLAGLTIVGLGNDNDLATRTAKRVVERCGGTFVVVNPSKLVAPIRASLQAVLYEHKKAADKAYPAYLRQAGRTIPAAARNSGLIYLAAGQSLADDLARADLAMDDVQIPGESLGLLLATLKALGLALLQSDATPLFKASRLSGAASDGAHSLPSQVSASLTSSRGQPDPSFSPNVAPSAALPASSPDKASLGSAVDTSFDIGDDDHDIGDLSLDILVAPPSPPLRPVSQVPATAPPSRSTTSTNPLDNWGSAIPPPAARSRRKAASAAEGQAPVPLASLPQSAHSSLSAGSQPFVDDSFEEPAPQLERAKSLYQTIRAKSRGDLASQPPTAARGQSLASGKVEGEDDDDGEAFVEGQRKRRRAEQAIEEEKRKRARVEDQPMDDVEAADPGVSSVGQSSREASAMVDSVPESRAPGMMPPPPVPSRAKRKADDTGASDTDFLRAPVKRKRKGQAEDALDVDFNNLEIAKLPSRPAGVDTAAVAEDDEDQPRLVEVLVPLFQRTKLARRGPAALPVTDSRGFGKFRSNRDFNAPHGTRRQGPAIPTVGGESALRARGKNDVKPEAAEYEELKPSVVDSASAASYSGSASERATQTGSAGTSGPSVGRRKRLIAAGDSDDDMPVRASARGRKKAGPAVAASDDKAAAASSRPTPRTTATLDDSDEEDAPPARPKARVGRKKLIQAENSDEEGFKGWGGASRTKRR